MAKIKITGVKKVESDALRRVQNIIADSKIYEGVEEIVKETIREGKNPKTGRPYKKLADPTVKHRKYIAKYNSTHPDYRAKRSNLTLIGATIDAIFSRFNKTNGVLTIDVKGTHPGYKSKKGRTIKGSKKPFKEIASALEEIGRPFLVFSKKLQNELVKRIEQALRRL